MELARWIARTRARHFNASETHRTIRGVLHASKAMQQACEVLQQAAWIRPAMRRSQEWPLGRHAKTAKIAKTPFRWRSAGSFGRFGNVGA
jgi:hypothetical protein